MLKLAQRMTSGFCTSLSPSILNNWATLPGDGDEDIRVSTPKNVENPELRISAATSLWLPVTPQKSFDFLRDLNRRSQVKPLFLRDLVIKRLTYIALKNICH